MIVCGTGHRPNKLGGYSPLAHITLVDLATEWLEESLKQDNGVSSVVSGGALGWDQALAQAAINLGIHITLALPFENFDSKWPGASRAYLQSLIRDSDEVVYVCEPGYNPYKMQLRNQWMVDNSNTVLALWNGTDGGTHNCIKYANKKNKPSVNLWERYEQIANSVS